eukprot:457339_1
MGTGKSTQPANNAYDLVSGFLRQYNINWHPLICNNQSLDAIRLTKSLRQRIVNYIVLSYFGKQAVKVLFLDVDGVLNTNNDSDEFGLNVILIQRLCNIINKTNCKIVLSTDWRLKEKHINDLFIEIKKKGHIDLDNDNIYIGNTPRMSIVRAFEIQAYLNDKYINTIYDILSWCAIDDRNLINPSDTTDAIQKMCFKIMFDHFVHTNSQYGLTEKAMNYAIAKLNDY